MKVSWTSTDQSYLRASTDSMTCAVTQTDHISEVAFSTGVVPQPSHTSVYFQSVTSKVLNAIVRGNMACTWSCQHTFILAEAHVTCLAVCLRHTLRP